MCFNLLMLVQVSQNMKFYQVKCQHHAYIYTLLKVKENHTRENITTILIFRYSYGVQYHMILSHCIDILPYISICIADLYSVQVLCMYVCVCMRVLCMPVYRLLGI